MTGSPYVLAIDQGTTSTRAILFDAQGAVRRTAQRELTQHYPQPGWVEHDPEEIWQSVVATCREAAAAADGPIAALGVANQRETAVLWERATGRPVHNAIVWQDRRTAELCARWRREGLAEIVAQRTGLVIDPYFSASKIRWLLDAVPGVRRRAEEGEIAFGTIDSFLLWRLTGGRRHATDATNAARTMLFDIGRLAWDDELLDAFDIPKAILPEMLDTGARFWRDRARIARRRDPDRGDGRRSAGGADRPGLLFARHDQIDLRHRRLCARQHRRARRPAPITVC